MAQRFEYEVKLNFGYNALSDWWGKNHKISYLYRKLPVRHCKVIFFKNVRFILQLKAEFKPIKLLSFRR